MNVTNLKAARRPVEGNQDEFVILDQDSKEVASIKGDSEITLSLTLNGLEFVSPPQSKMIGEDGIYITLSSLKNFIYEK